MSSQGQRIVGIDPGLRLTGYGCIKTGHRSDDLTMVEAGVIRVPQKRPLHERLAYLHDSVADLLADLSPDVIVVESAFVHRTRGQTALQMGHGRGVILLAAAQYARAPKQDRSTEVAIIELSPAEIKQSVTGSGRAAKEQVQHATASILGLPGPIDQPDASDALAMAIAGTTRGFAARDEIVER